MRMLLRFAAALLLLSGLFAAAPVRAQGPERILRFVSDIKVERNGDLMVTETIRVQANGDVIKRGILRDFPTSYTNRDGSHIEITFDVQSVTRDGGSENFTTERLSNGYRLRIGSAERTVSRGEHEYVIRYRTTRQVGFFKDYDELYWNVTGNGWTFPIDVAEARITLPEAARFGQTAVYTGPQGGREKNAEVVETAPGRIVFRTTRALPPRHGLTVAAAFDKGIVVAPTEAERWTLWIHDNAPIAATAAALLAMLGFLLVGWLLAGRDPPRGTMVPLFSPPAGMSAPAVRYVRQMEMDDKTFAAALVDMAVRGHARLVEKKKAEGMRLEPRKGGAALPPDEAAMEKRLFTKSGGPVDISQENHGVFERARAALDAELTKAYADKFYTNSGWATLGVLLSLVLCAGVVLVAYWGWGPDKGSLVALCMGSFVPGVIVLTVLALRGWPSSAAGYIFLIFGTVFAAVFALGGLGLLDAQARGPLQFVPAFAPLVLVPLAASALTWMKAHSAEGRRLTDQIEGFRHYLGVAERDRLNALNPPQETAELFEKYLPYAIALDVENEWGKRFATVLAAAAVGAAAQQAAGTGTGSWYQGQRDWSDWSSNPSGFATHLGSGLSETIAAASVPPASTTSPSSSFSSSSDSGSSYSGGSSGGGSSGGGGGGGGGSGW